MGSRTPTQIVNDIITQNQQLIRRRHINSYSLIYWLWIHCSYGKIQDMPVEYIQNSTGEWSNEKTITVSVWWKKYQIPKWHYKAAFTKEFIQRFGGVWKMVFLKIKKKKKLTYKLFSFHVHQAPWGKHQDFFTSLAFKGHNVTMVFISMKNRFHEGRWSNADINEETIIRRGVVSGHSMRMKIKCKHGEFNWWCIRRSKWRNDEETGSLARSRLHSPGVGGRPCYRPPPNGP